MRTHQQWLTYQELELISARSPHLRKKHSAILAIAKTIWSHLLMALSSGFEFRVYQTTDHNGQTWWHIYDPIDRRSLHFASENEMRAWVDARCRGFEASERSFWN